jgi:predicted DNA-binding transcriptional regulator YafY
MYNKMIVFKFKDIDQEFPDEKSCLEWLKNKRYPEGIKCPVCNKITKHHRLSRRPCYECDNCGNQVYPTSGTMFHRSKVPLKTWFKVIQRLSSEKHDVSLKTIQSQYGLTYGKAHRMFQIISEYFNENTSLYDVESKLSGTNIKSPISDHKTNKKIITSNFKNRQVGLIDRKSRKRDRTARLLYLQILLWQHPYGLEITDIARNCATSVRTVYRDLIAIESELKVPIWEKGNKRGLIDGYFLPPITFTQDEAMSVYYAIRLMQTYPHLYNPSVISTFTKLSSIIPSPLKQEITETLENMEKQPKDARKLKNLNKLTDAWSSQHRVMIRYQTIKEKEPTEHIIETYFIEPSSFDRSFFIIAYCRCMKTIYPFKLDYIVGDVEMLRDNYTIPTDIHATNYITSEWDIQPFRPLLNVKLRINKGFTRVIADTIWHPSQKLEQQSDGSVIMTVEVHLTDIFISWVLGWGNNVEVLEPEILRENIVMIAKSLTDLYMK